MKKINSKHDNKDRIICKTEIGKHRFYYQPIGTNECFWLFDTKNFSGSILEFFKKYGKNLNCNSFSMTLKQLYDVGYGENVKINKIIDRLPMQIEYVIRENREYSYTEIHDYCRC